MSWREAPLYVESHDLALWVLERSRAWPEPGPLGTQIAVAACDLVVEVSLALTFRVGRVEHLRHADEAIVRLRTLLRLARDLGLVSPRGLRFATGRLRAIGRMLGGWRKRVDRRGFGDEQRVIGDDDFQGVGPPATGA